MYQLLAKRFFLFLTLFSLLTVAMLLTVRGSDKNTYLAFAKKADSLSQTASSSNQKRQSVRKDIWFTQEDSSRLHYRIDSQSSEIFLTPKHNRLDLIENLSGIRCWMQDRLYVSGNAPMQEMRFFEADKGTYHHSTQAFLAKSAALSIFRLPGHALPFTYDPRSAFLQGVAEDISFSVAGKNPRFQAGQFKASLRKQEGIR